MDAAEAHQRIADSGVVIGWLGYGLSHIAEINAILQMILLMVSIIASIVAIRYHLRRLRS